MAEEYVIISNSSINQLIFHNGLLKVGDKVLLKPKRNGEMQEVYRPADSYEAWISRLDLSPASEQARFFMTLSGAGTAYREIVLQVIKLPGQYGWEVWGNGAEGQTLLARKGNEKLYRAAKGALQGARLWVEENLTKHRNCSRCKATRPIDEFRWRKHKAEDEEYYRDGYCDSCHREMKAITNAKYRDNYRASERQIGRRLKPRRR